MALSAYAILGLPENASLDAAKKAYRALAKQCHPDLAGHTPDADRRFRAITEALREIEQRARHQKQSSTCGPRRPAPRTLSVLLTLEEAVNGTTRRLEVGPQITSLIRIPPGVEHGALLCIPALERGTKAPEIILQIEIAAHEMFRVQGADIFLLLQTSPGLLARGGMVEAPTPHGALRLRIEKGATPGQVLRVKGKGLPARAGRPAGALYVTLKVGERTQALNSAINAFTKRWSRGKPAA